MSFVEAVRSVFSKYVQFEGRARRSEYWYFTLFNMIVGAIFGLLITIGGDGAIGKIFYALSSLYSLAVFLPSLAVCWRRLHDIGKSGANYFWVLVPLVGAILLLVWLARNGDVGDNAYGRDPKAGDSAAYQAEEKAPWER